MTMNAASNQNHPMSPVWDNKRVVLSGGTILDIDRSARNVAAHGRAGFAGSLLGGMIERIRIAVRQRRTQRELSALDDRTLADLGIARSDIPAIARGQFVSADANDLYRGSGVGSPANDRKIRNVAA
jgi:uncharacterized protein YjiS (DUF1127 family)